MNLKVLRNSLQIIPEFRENREIEIAYFEEVLGLKKDGDYVKLVRRNASGLSCIAYLETVKE